MSVGLVVVPAYSTTTSARSPSFSLGRGLMRSSFSTWLNAAR